jgi:hypothetical protein
MEENISESFEVSSEPCQERRAAVDAGSAPNDYQVRQACKIVASKDAATPILQNAIFQDK